MSEFVVSARKYRPATFESVVGQSAITTTLKNAIKNKHLAQAFLFCGPRGVGKTTCARILAKTINCANITDTIEACNECEACIAFNEGQSLNIYELDAASNNSVDDIRALIEQVRFAPQLGKYKVYIIDEVHMLSTSAFNAFLKTLEEPPSHAIFILATTEKHKILPTILSRCQIFDFQRIRINDIANHLAYIAKNEGVNAEFEALHVIAQKADGALRDACSIFDQLVSFSGNTLTYQSTIDNLNILDYDYYFKVTDAILKADIPATLLILNEIINKGFDPHHFITGLAEHFRNMMVCKDAATIQLLEVGENIKEKYLQQSKSCNTEMMLTSLTVLNKADIGYKNSKNQRLLVELALMQLCSINLPATEGEKKNDFNAPILIGVPIKSAEGVITKAIPETNSAIKKELTVVTSTAATAVADTASKTIIRKGSASGGMSISSLLSKTKTENKTAEEEQKIIETGPITDFTQSELELVWNEYIELLKTNNKINLATTFSSRKPELTNNNTIEFLIDNKSQEEEINNEKQHLMGFIRKSLKNYSVQLNLQINKNDNQRKAYTTNDKFKKMAEKNPLLNKLKQELDLDIEY